MTCDETVILLDDDAFNEFTQVLEEAPKPNPALEELLQRPTRWVNEE